MKIFSYIGKKSHSREMNKEIETLYELYKYPFIQFAVKYYSVSEDTAMDAY